MNIVKLMRKNIRTLKPYEAKEIKCKAKLDANESPFAFPDLLKKALTIQTNRYPDPEGLALKKAASRVWKIKPENILLGNGSDELIYYLILTFGGPVLFPVPTFSMYEIISRAVGEKAIGIKLDRNFDLDTEKFIKAIKKYKPKLIFLSSPNNPTGNCFSTDRIFEIVNASKALVVVDEAYQPFSSKNGFIPFLQDFENLLIMRTLSKIGFASLRVGFLISSPEIINAANRVRLPFNLNSLSQAVAVEVFRNYRSIMKTVKDICNERDRVYKALEDMPGINPFPTEANFILFKVKDASKIHKALLKKGVLVRDMTSVVKDALRVTVGSPEENNLFLRALGALMK